MNDPAAVDHDLTLVAGVAVSVYRGTVARVAYNGAAVHSERGFVSYLNAAAVIGGVSDKSSAVHSHTAAGFYADRAADLRVIRAAALTADNITAVEAAVLIRVSRGRGGLRTGDNAKPGTRVDIIVMSFFSIAVIQSQRGVGNINHTALAARIGYAVTVEIKDMLAGRNADGTAYTHVRRQLERASGRPRIQRVGE